MKSKQRKLLALSSENVVPTIPFLVPGDWGNVHRTVFEPADTLLGEVRRSVHDELRFRHTLSVELG